MYNIAISHTRWLTGSNPKNVEPSKENYASTNYASVGLSKMLYLFSLIPVFLRCFVAPWEGIPLFLFLQYVEKQSIKTSFILNIFLQNKQKNLL